MENWQQRELEADRVEQMYDEVEEAIIALLIAALATGDVLEVTRAGQQSKRLLYEAYEQTKVWNAEAIPALYGKKNALSAETIEAITDASDARFAAMTNTASRRIDEFVASFRIEEARRRTLRELVRGRMPVSAKSLAADIVRALSEAGITGFTDSSGRRWRLRVYADMAARTTVMEADLAGVKDRVIAAGQDLVNLIGPLDYPDGCPPAVKDGPYSLTGSTTEYQGRAVITVGQMVAQYGVFHPRCRHSLSPVGV